MQNLIQENQSLADEVRNAQENLRLSANTIAKLNAELSDHKSRNTQESDTYKQKIQKLLAENTSLGDEMRNAQENLRLSANTIAKLNTELKATCNELEEAKRRVAELAVLLDRKNQESSKLTAQIQEMSAMGSTIQTLQERIQRLVGENKGLSGEVQEAQENLRLSAQQNQKALK
jgi:chromosome segregation ATPase